MMRSNVNKEQNKNKIKTLTLKDFQCHKKLTIRLDPHVTVITGTNDKGKSAIIRALRMLALNRPSGKAFIRSKRKQSKILLTVGKHTISRQIGTNSTYQLDSKVYKAFRTEVPPDIKKLLHVDEINFQQQHEPVFWFSLSAGQVAKELNKLIDLDSIDRSQSYLQKLLRTSQAELSVCETRLRSARQLANRLRWVNGCLDKMGVLDKLAIDHATKSHQIARIASRLRLAVAADTTAADATAATAAARLAARWGRLTARCQCRANRLAGLIGGLSQLTAGTVPGGWDRIEKLVAKDREEAIERLTKLLSLLQVQETIVCEAKEELRQQKELLEEKLGGRCPTCGGILTNQITLM